VWMRVGSSSSSFIIRLEYLPKRSQSFRLFVDYTCQHADRFFSPAEIDCLSHFSDSSLVGTTVAVTAIAMVFSRELRAKNPHKGGL
jgi:hypothetical protein